MEKKNKKNEENKNNKKNEINPYCDINYLKGLGDFFIEDDDEDMNIDIDINDDVDIDDDISDININDDVDDDVDEDDDEDDNYIEEDTKKKRKRKKKNEDEPCKYMIRNNEYSYAEACKRTLYWREKTKSWAGRKDGDIYDTKEEAEKVLEKVSRLPNGKSGQCEERELKIIQVAADFASKRGAYYIEGRHHPCAKQKVRDRSRTIAKQKAWEDELTTYCPRYDPLDGSYIGD